MKYFVIAVLLAVKFIKRLLMVVGTVVFAFIVAVMAGGAYSRLRNPKLDQADRAMADTDEVLVIGLTFLVLIITVGVAWLAHRRRTITLRSHLPTAREINPVFTDLDGRCAERHFLGKTLQQAEALFREASIIYQEDLMFMGPIAFRFYVQAAISYIQSDAATEDSAIISCFAGVLEHRVEFEAEELVAIAPQLASICRYILEHYDSFCLNSEIDGDLRLRFQALEQTFSRQLPA
jgi:hypothetical protein